MSMDAGTEKCPTEGGVEAQSDQQQNSLMNSMSEVEELKHLLKKQREPPLSLRYVVDVLAAAGASLLVSPFITIIDRAIIENASGKRSLGAGMKIYTKDFLTKPHRFLVRKEFMYVYALYFGTYLAANTVDTTCEHLDHSSTWPKFLATSSVNVALCLWKDRAFTRMFGLGTPKPLKMFTFSMFAIRDTLTNVASFTLPGVATSYLQTERGWNQPTADKASQLVCPAVMQLFSTPLHLLGVDVYNHPKAPIMERLSLIRKEYWKSAAARVGRIGPAFGFGGISNRYLRDNLDSYLYFDPKTGIKLPLPRRHSSITSTGVHMDTIYVISPSEHWHWPR